MKGGGGVDQMAMANEKIEAMAQEISALRTTIDRLTALVEEKNEIIRNLNRTQFGQRSEKRRYLVPKGQIGMFEITGDGITDKAPEDATEQKKKEIHVSGHMRKAKRTLEELSANLPKRGVCLDFSEEEKITADGRPLKYIGTYLIRSELVVEPERRYILNYYGRSYSDPIVEEQTGHADIRRPEAPVPLLPHSYTSASVVTDIITKKYVDALPLYRQEQMWKRHGVKLNRNTMANWVIQTADRYLKPFADAFMKILLQQRVIHTDETVVQVNKEPGRAATAESRIWAHASSKRAAQQIRVFRYEVSRKGACVEKVLGNYTGVVISDGYSGYNALSKSVRAGCWAHARRKWI